jgi:hypothetical protein
MIATTNALAGDVAPLSLDELTTTAELLTRVDRKYVIHDHVVRHVVDQIAGSLRVLEIDGERRFGYESVYFDTPDLRSYRRAAQDRPNRFKVRTRRYLDPDICMLEVKVQGCRGETIKHRIEHNVDDQFALTANGEAFVAEFVDLDRPIHELLPTLTTRYHRTTLVDGEARITIDSDLSCVALGSSRELTLTGRLIVETKSAGPVTRFDRLLWAAGVRPVSISKYAIGMAGLDPRLPANKWNQVLRRHIGWLPDRSAPHS